MRAPSFFIVLPLVFIGCSKVENYELEGVDKISSMQLKENGFFDVICTDGTREVISAKDLNRGNVCPYKPAAPIEGEIFAPAESISSYSGCSTATVTTFGNEADKFVYDGFVSFTVSASIGHYSHELKIEVTDGYNAKWVTNVKEGSGSNTTRYHKLKLPAKVAITWNNCPSNYYTNKVDVSNKALYQTSTNEMRYTGDITRYETVATLAPSLENAAINIDVDLKLFNNFTAGTDCGRISFIGKNKQVNVTNQNPSTVIANLVAPILVTKNPLCQTSRLPSPEKKESDYDMKIKVLFVNKG